MSNTTAGILIVAGVAGGAVFYAKRRREQKSILARARRKAGMIAERASKLSDSVADMLDKGRAEVENQKKGIVEAVGAGKAAYQRVAG